MPTELPGLHPRLTVLQAAPAERAPLIEHLAHLWAAAGTDPDREPAVVDVHDFHTAAREAAIRRVEDHERVRGELSTQLRQARDMQAVAVNRRDEAAARARRLSSHLADCDALLERAGELTNAAEEARRTLDERRAELEDARNRLQLVEEQRVAAKEMIADATAQLADLETAELHETTLRREVDRANDRLRAAEASHAEATDRLRSIEQAAASRAATREHLLRVRADLVARIEAPLIDTEPVRQALADFDADAALDEPDPVAQDLAREWLEVDDELARLLAALPEPPTPEEIDAAERHLQEIDAAIATFEDSGGGPHPGARDEIEAAHEAVLVAEEDLDHAHDPEAAYDALEHARQVEQAVLARHGYETYLDVILAGEEAGGADHAELAHLLRARRVAEETLTSLRAAAEPPAILTALQTRQDRIYREAADILGCDPGDNVAELLYAQPLVPVQRTRALVAALAQVGVVPVGMSARDAAISWLVEQDRELTAREEYRREVDRVDADLAELDDEDAHAVTSAEQAVEMAQLAYEELQQATARVQQLEEEMSDRATQDERRLQRIAVAEQLRAQIAAVVEAIERTDDEYHSAVESAEAATIAAEANLERATAELSDAVRRLRRIAETLPPALRPRAGDDPLGELPRLRDTLAGEVERADAALDAATQELEQARAEIDETQARLDDHLTVVPTDDVTDEDLCQGVRDLVGTGEATIIIDDPFDEVEDVREPLLEALAAAAERRTTVLLTDDPTTLGWAISLPSDIGAVTRMPASPDPDQSGDGAPLAAHGEPAP